MVSLIAAVVVSLTAAVADIQCMRIPNWLTYSAMLFGVGYHTMVGGTHGFLFGAGGLFLGLALLIVFYLAGGMGAGDVKLMAAVGALLGPKDVFIAFLFTALVGGIYAIILLVLRFRVMGAAVRLTAMSSALRPRTGSPPPTVDNRGRLTVLNYGVAIAAGVLLSIIWKLYI